MELLQPADNDYHAEFILIASTLPASNEELRDTYHIRLFCMPQSNEVREQPVPPAVNHTWHAPICQGDIEKVFVMAADNGAAVAQPNLHQRTLCHAEAIPHLVKYPRAQCYKKCQTCIRRHKKMELPPNRFHRKIQATNRLLEGAPCLTCTTRIRQTGRRLVCWSYMAQYHFNCMMSNRTKIVRTQRSQCTHCSQKPVADSQDNQMTQLFYKKTPGVHQYLLRILHWNANGIHRELQLLEDFLEATNEDVVCIQKTMLQPKDKTPEPRNFNEVRHVRPVQREARRGPYDLHPITDSLQNQPPTGHQFIRDEETDD